MSLAAQEESCWVRCFLELADRPSSMLVMESTTTKRASFSTTVNSSESSLKCPQPSNGSSSILLFAWFLYCLKTQQNSIHTSPASRRSSLAETRVFWRAFWVSLQTALGVCFSSSAPVCKNYKMLTLSFHASSNLYESQVKDKYLGLKMLRI